ncbi:MAG: glycerol-3-phosphate dehydrogenase/oxidase [Deltaproteobacteria bacterium]|nr:MAG: glycerol-3-phosphate dehydrogenase/oxidase [Deltaproteobacteria bacterium]
MDDVATAIGSESSPAPEARRRAGLARLAEHGVDVLVVGGGITGAGIARDAALRGLSVAIVEKTDWGAGTSSRSSKLVHGGLRYLENYQFGLVMESTRERHRQSRLNPHLVWPIPFLMPVYAGSRHGMAKLNLGLWLYDLLSMFRTYRVHRKLRPERARELAPGLRADGLRGGLHYFDCRTDDARLTLANVLDAQRHGAIALNYTRFVAPLLDADGRVTGATLADELDGSRTEVRCKHLVYATGHWSDHISGAPGGGRLIRPTKGVHLVVPHDRLPVATAVTLTAVRDGRVMFAIPAENTTYIGTTDTDYDGDLDDIRATADDIDYILETANHYFPDAHLTGADVMSTWAGLRPLIRDDADSAYKTSREHEIFPSPSGITTIAGGKLTTYRAMAEELMRHVVRDLAKHHGVKAKRCCTHKVPLDPGVRQPEDLLRGPEDAFERNLWRQHGSAGSWVHERMKSHPAEAATLTPDLPIVLAQVSLAVLGEHAMHLEDVLVRRLPVFYRAADQGLGCGRAVATHMAALLGRDERWVADEVRAWEALVEASRAWRDPETARLAQSA